MKPIKWDSGVKWDSVNTRWSDPSYILEPGDPGYVNTGPVPGETQPKKKQTAMSASNETPRNLKVLLALAHDLADGMTQLQATIGLHHHIDATLRPLILKLEGDPDAAVGSNANKGSQLVFKDSEKARDDAEAAVMALSDGAVKTLLSGYRTVLTGVHGNKFNAGWAAAGFTGNSTAVPRSHDARFALLAAMRAYLAAHSSYEGSLPQATGSALAVTAAAALALHTQFSNLREAVNTADGVVETCMGLRDADLDALYDEVSSAITEIRGQLAADDPRWETLGLNIPANPTPPVAVEALTVVAAGTGRELASWPHARRATAYRAFIKIDGVDEDFRAVERVQDLEYTYKGLTPGQTVSIHIVATNEAGDAAPSPTVTKVVGA